jgi:type IV secretory pathway VirD2 relaxase
MRQDASLRGEDRLKWSIENAWAVHILRRKLQATRFSRTPDEQRHFRIRLCPETKGGVFLRDSGRMQEFAERFIAAIEADYVGNFYWVAAAHYNTDQPHVHICLRGIDVQGTHVFFDRRYLKASDLELQANSSASSPIEWRARNILGQMIRESKGTRYAG